MSDYERYTYVCINTSYNTVRRHGPNRLRPENNTRSTRREQTELYASNNTYSSPRADGV